MMEGLAMLRQLIGQVQEFLELHGSPPTVPPNYFLQFRAQSTPQRHLRWCFVDLDNSSVDYDCYNLIMTAGKSENLKMLEPGKPPPTKKARKESRRGKVIASTSSTENMEQHIWKEFPEDLFEAVIARLPIATFFRFRSVCRKWNSLLVSQSFSQQCVQVTQAPTLVLHHHT
ncbi:F-box only protein 6 [Abeliophyllum distichum]|uniref:F-box only protein 6 n=1 Tax=Abeliophyllum distichum TaxID=126358 RepID=A0ABD1UHX0_9LAMI